MESSEKGAGVVDCSVGSIVWVRRRNGSWWPGKILGPDELSAAHLMSPRSGTPVKLLGREDASVDWYNLEKSKRVKAFRCGEFDDCIERAESSQGMPPKKREKYARREDAILHALELEKQLLQKEYDKSGSSSNGMICKAFDDVEQKLPPSGCLDVGNSDGVESKSYPEKLDSSIEDKSMYHPLYAQKVEEGHQLAQDEGNSEVVPRMRGLQDFGLIIAPSKQKPPSSVTLNGYQHSEFDNKSRPLPSSRLSIESAVHANGQGSMDNRKKSHEMLTNESLVRRRDRRRPLVQVLQSSAEFPVHPALPHGNDNVSTVESGEEQTAVICHAKRSRCNEFPSDFSDCLDDKQLCTNQIIVSPSCFDENNSSHPAALGEKNSPEPMDNTETDSTETESLDSDADEEMEALSGADVVTELEPKSLGRAGAQMQHGNMSGDPDDLAVASDVSHPSAHSPFTSSVGISKWQLKGKRNNRRLSRRSIAAADRRDMRSSMYGINLEDRENNGCDELDLIEKNYRTSVSPFDNQGYFSMSKSTSKGLDKISNKMINWEDLAWGDQPVLRGYWEDSSNYFDPVSAGHRGFGGRIKSMLVDVDLKVQSSYQREHVPMISLMSKLNGQAIVGHPIQIETLENGATETLLSAADGISSEILDNDISLSPLWRTARRTANFRIPRPHPPTTLDGEETVGHFEYADLDKKVISRKSSLGSFGQKAGMMKKSLSHNSRLLVDRRNPRKPLKKIRLSSSQKIKTLSSIGKEQQFGNDLKHGMNSSEVNGLIKGESGLTVVACIPVKLVFSRLYEELVGRHQ